jgi:hypothetical protein
MAEIRIGKFLSRDIDRVAMRTGRSGFHPQRLVFMCDEQGKPVVEVCRVSFPTDVPDATSLKKLEGVMRCLDAGITVLNSEPQH